MEAFDRLVAIMARLRAPDGCPWDREQTHRSLRPYLLEEAHEVLECLDRPSLAGLGDELGDLLLQVVFHAQLASEEGSFDIQTVCAGICDKLVRRHPHIFGEVGGVERPEQVAQLWGEVKRAERGAAQAASTLDGVGRTLPALARAQDLQQKAALVGFDWPDQAGRLEKLVEEIGELREATAVGDHRAMEDELGDVLFAVVNTARGLGVNAEDCLRAANAKFEARFRQMETSAGGPDALGQLDLSAQDALWDQAKSTEGDGKVGQA